MKKIAFYLPQYHAIPENDKWWGEGFTEWTNVKKSEPQYKGHIQPEVPLESYYYNLLDERVQVKQAELAKKYGVDAFCYYHYWFEGKLLLEKPMENMLNNKEVDIPFCVCWANETWARTWDGRETDVLIKQNYDEGEEGWKKHFLYLLPFFKDSRYLTNKGKPFLLIYKPHLITRCKEMLEYWRKLALEEGLEGLYIGYQHHSAYDYDMEGLGFDFGVEFEPFYTVREIKNYIETRKFIYAVTHPKWFFRKIKEKMFGRPILYDYDDIWKNILNRKPISDKIIPGAFTAWDNTPRRGKSANIFVGANPKKFEGYFAEQCNRGKEIYNSEYIFINAWNEWAEGAHLEPDEYNGYGYLEAVSKIK